MKAGRQLAIGCSCPSAFTSFPAPAAAYPRRGFEHCLRRRFAVQNADFKQPRHHYSAVVRPSFLTVRPSIRAVRPISLDSY
jgi:hypothetical protein